MPGSDPGSQPVLAWLKSTMPRLQFSLFRLMVAVTLVALVLFLAVTVGGFLMSVFEAFVWCIVPTPLVICAVYGRGDAQAFSIGALVPFTVILVLHAGSISPFTTSLWLLALGGICGILAAATRRWIQSQPLR